MLGAEVLHPHVERIPMIIERAACLPHSQIGLPCAWLVGEHAPLALQAPTRPALRFPNNGVRYAEPETSKSLRSTAARDTLATATEHRPRASPRQGAASVSFSQGRISTGSGGARTRCTLGGAGGTASAAMASSPTGFTPETIPAPPAPKQSAPTPRAAPRSRLPDNAGWHGTAGHGGIRPESGVTVGPGRVARPVQGILHAGMQGILHAGPLVRDRINTLVMM